MTSPRQDAFEQRINIAYKAFCRATEDGVRAPSNSTIAALCGYSGGGGGGTSGMFAEMVKRGLISVTQHNSGTYRVITIIETGKSTAPPPKPNKITRAPKHSMKAAVKSQRSAKDMMSPRYPVKTITLTNCAGRWNEGL